MKKIIFLLIFLFIQTPGSEISDDWIGPALERIDRIRKSLLTVKCIDTNENPLQGVKIIINQTRRHFPFGTAVAANLFGGKEYNQKYVKKVEELFNIVTIENHLKWEAIEWAHPAVDWVFNWAKIPVRGHCLFWPSYEHCPPWLKNLP
jgi:GH35 family endo-1,4-beta-xylanase